jgi:HlyD family secretion protein
MKKFLIGLAIVVVIAGMIYLNLNKDTEFSLAASASVRNAKPVKVTRIEKGDIYSYVTAPGRVEETNKAQVFFDTPLRVLKVHVKKNDLVKKGSKLVDLDTSSLYDEIEKLKVQKEIQSITLEKLESGQSLLSLESSLASARHAYDQAQDNYQMAYDEFVKQQKLYETGVIPKTQLDQYDRAVKDMQAAVDTALVNLQNAEKAYQSSLSGHDLDIQAQVKNIELLSSQIADIEKRLAKINSLQKAPIEGYVTEVSLIDGGYTVSGHPAFTIIDVENLQITATVNEYNTKDLATGQHVLITGDALGDDTEFSGEIIEVAPVATTYQSSSGIETVVEVVIRPDEGKELLKPGLNVDCDIFTNEKNGVVIAEFNIFINDKDGTQYVMLVDEDSMTVKKQEVTLGIYSDMMVEIIDGLKPGDMVVVDPQPSLQDGDKVRIME